MKHVKLKHIFRIIAVLLLLTAIISIISVFVIWFKTPELTTMEIMIEWWGLYLSAFISWILFYVFLMLSNEY